MKTFRVIAGLCGMLLLSACAGSSDKNVAMLQGPNATVKVHIEVADTEASRERGLMDRTILAADAGMLFVMDRAQVLSFWMKSTLIPLDIAFFDAQKRFVSSSTMTPCTADPCAIYRSAAPALYALEVSKGFMKAHGVGTGWILGVETPNIAP